MVIQQVLEEEDEVEVMIVEIEVEIEGVQAVVREYLEVDVLTVDLIETLHQAVKDRGVISVIIVINQATLQGIVRTSH